MYASAKELPCGSYNYTWTAKDRRVWNLEPVLINPKIRPDLWITLSQTELRIEVLYTTLITKEDLRLSLNIIKALQLRVHSKVHGIVKAYGCHLYKTNDIFSLEDYVTKVINNKRLLKEITTGKSTIRGRILNTFKPNPLKQALFKVERINFSIDGDKTLLVHMVRPPVPPWSHASRI